MRVLGLLSFFDEEPEHLIAATHSLTSAGVDHLVAVDGAYELFPDAKASSGPSCHDALREATDAGGIGLTLHVPSVPWHGNEVEKRTFMFRIAHTLAEPYDDWLFVFDADEVVLESGDYRDHLAATSLNVAAVLHGERGVRPRSERRLFRAHPRGIEVRRVHYFYVDGDGDVLWGPGQVERLMLEQVRVHHRPRDRTRERHEARNRYYEDRLVTQAEPELFV